MLLDTQEPQDTYFKFGGAALADMFKIRYTKLRSCTDQKRKSISAELTVLQSMKSTCNDASLPDSLQ